MTIMGQGFDPNNVNVTICGVLCELVDTMTQKYDELYCYTPAGNASGRLYYGTVHLTLRGGVGRLYKSIVPFNFKGGGM